MSMPNRLPLTVGETSTVQILTVKCRSSTCLWQVSGFAVLYDDEHSFLLHYCTISSTSYVTGHRGSKSYELSHSVTIFWASYEFTWVLNSFFSAPAALPLPKISSVTPGPGYLWKNIFRKMCPMSHPLTKCSKWYSIEWQNPKCTKYIY